MIWGRSLVGVVDRVWVRVDVGEFYLVSFWKWGRVSGRGSLGFIKFKVL